MFLLGEDNRMNSDCVNLGGSYQTRLYRPAFDVRRQIRATSPQAKTENALFC